MTNWPVKTLGDVCEVVNGATPDTKALKNWGGAHVWITPAEMGGLDSPFLSSSRRTLSDEGLASCSARLVPPHAVILSSRAPIGHVVINAVPMATNQGCKSLIPGKDLDFKFLFYFLKGNVELLESLGTGTTFKELSGTQLKKVALPVPPMEEQKRIVALLDDVTARITELTACYERARTHANDLFTSALRDALESNPDWPVKTLGDVCEVIAGQSPEGKFYNQAGRGTPFYQGKKDFTERFLGSPSTWTTEITKLAQPGDILMSVRAPVGPVNLCPVEACIGRGLAAIRPSREVDTEFIYYYLESIQSEIAGTEGAVFASINKAQIANLRCPVPPMEEQKRIVARLDQMWAKTSEMVAAYDAKLQAAKSLRQSILEAAFAGEL